MPILPDIPAAQIAIVEITNAFRRDNQLAKVRIDPKLSDAAARYARFLAASQLFSHTADGRRPVDRIKAAGYEACQTAENLAAFLDSRGFETRQLAHKMVEAWKGSPGHRKNMLLPHVTETGIGIAKARGEEKYYAVQLFGRPARLRYRFEVHNRANVTVPFRLGEKTQDIKPNFVVRLTACQPEVLAFTLPDGTPSTFKPAAGTTYTLQRAKTGRVVVESAPEDGAMPIEAGK